MEIHRVLLYAGVVVVVVVGVIAVGALGSPASGALSSGSSWRALGRSAEGGRGEIDGTSGRQLRRADLPGGL